MGNSEDVAYLNFQEDIRQGFTVQILA